MEHWRHTLERWSAAGLLDTGTADRIAAFEEQHAAAANRNFEWPVLIALIFGGIALGAGLLLLAASHWDSFGPGVRFSMVIAMVVVLHAGGIFAADTPSFRGPFHLLGSIAFGAGIFLARSVFQMTANWEHGMSMWVLGTATSWWLLRDVPQTVLLASLAPFAFGAEYLALCAPNNWASRWGAEFGTMIAIVYLSAVYPEKNSRDRNSLVWVGSIALVPAAVYVGIATPWNIGVPLQHSLVAAAAALGAAWVLRRKHAWINALFCVCTICIASLQPKANDNPNVLLYALYALLSGGMVWWGLRENRPERVNFGIAGFALTVVCFYVSNVFDKMGRSASLIGLGALLLAGGWFLERTRRNLVSGIPSGDSV